MLPTKKNITLSDKELMYNRFLVLTNRLAHDLAALQASLIPDMEAIADDLDIDIEVFPVRAEYYDDGIKILRIETPFYPPRLDVVTVLRAGSTPYAAKNDPYAKRTYREVRETWYKSIKNALIGALVPKLLLDKAIAWYTFYVPANRVRDADAYSVRFINNAFVRYGLLKDDDCSSLRFVSEMEYDNDNPRTEVILMEDTGILGQLKSQIAGHIKSV